MGKAEFELITLESGGDTEFFRNTIPITTREPIYITGTSQHLAELTMLFQRDCVCFDDQAPIPYPASLQTGYPLGMKPMESSMTVATMRKINYTFRAQRANDD